MGIWRGAEGTRFAGFGAFSEGAATPWAGWRYTCEHPALWRFGVASVAINLLISTALLVMLVGLAVYFLVALHPRFADGWPWTLLEVLITVLFAVAPRSPAGREEGLRSADTAHRPSAWAWR